MYQLSPSILDADFWTLGETVRAMEAGGADRLHLDIMDGVFVPSLSFGLPIVRSLSARTESHLDTHLMIIEPERYVADFAKAGADLIIVHEEATKDIIGVLKKIRACGCKAGLALNPETGTENLADFLPLLDHILVMTVHPGFGGQKYLPDSAAKIRAVSRLVRTSGQAVEIAVDGGINDETLPEVLTAGARIITAGSAVIRGDITANVRKYLAMLAAYEQEA